MVDSVFSYVGSILREDRCGYCGNTEGAHPRRCSFYLHTEAIDFADYKSLIDRGWRRSGMLLYKPHMSKTCCPQYTIRMDARMFKPSRDQRQCLHRWTRYVLGEEYIAEAAKKYPKSKEEKKKQNIFNLSESVHAPECANVKSHIPPLPLHNLKITLEPSDFTEEKYLLFENYQRVVHKEPPEEITSSGFRHFLCDSPFPCITSGQKLGTFHQCYWLDSRLIAMSVLDLLPGCVSGVYFMYHEDFNQWHLGKVSACREAALALEGGYGHYYMGYYIHSCVKMRYKGDYSPQELLDPVSYEWNPLDDAYRELLDREKYVSLSELKKAASQSIEENMVVDATAPEQVEKDSDDGYDEEGVERGGKQEAGFLFSSNMPGLMSKEELDAFDFGKIKIRLRGRMNVAKNLVGFHEVGRLRSLFEETVATVGPDVARNMVLTF